MRRTPAARRGPCFEFAGYPILTAGATAPLKTLRIPDDPQQLHKSCSDRYSGDHEGAPGSGPASQDSPGAAVLVCLRQQLKGSVGPRPTSLNAEASSHLSQQMQESSCGVPAAAAAAAALGKRCFCYWRSFSHLKINVRKKKKNKTCNVASEAAAE